MNDTSLKVMSWNLCFGGDIDPVFRVGFQDLELLTRTAGRVWDEVLANDFQDLRYFLDSTQNYRMATLGYLGRLAELRRRVPEELRDAINRGRTARQTVCCAWIILAQPPVMDPSYDRERRPGRKANDEHRACRQPNERGHTDSSLLDHLHLLLQS